MPCRSDYMDPNEAERDSRETCQCIVYVAERLGTPIPSWIGRAAEDTYGNQHRLNEAVVLLCAMITKMSEDEKTRIIYDGRSAQARKVAAWWERHEAADKARAEKEAKRLRDAKRTVPASNFVATMAANIDNKDLSDKDFRDFIRNSLPIVQYDTEK